MRKARPVKSADIAIYLLLVASCIITIVPIVHVLSISMSAPGSVYAAPIMLYPREVTLAAYRYIFDTDALLRAFAITVFITVAGTLLNLLVTVPAAYALSKRALPGLRWFMVALVLVMTFNAGIIPTYLMVKNVGLLNSVWAMIVPGLVNAFFLLLMRNFFMELPAEVEESAKMDGCSDIRLLAAIIVPLSLPVLATISLFYGVSHWNEFFKGLFYVTSPTKWPLQVLLKTIVFDQNFTSMDNFDFVTMRIEPMNVQSASIMVATLPIVCVYPFMQRFFVKGLVMGAVKG
ncbi:carbohydrate ABC transporter permease [Paenibacillus cymbidii]|uniref:carbohydrate ABC transporter permease n=1 Tax=Paenibacillus cymbidii TaxID=1639034 RepID=UPI001436A84A|nr:carbohydrate ABC transporter permease [Paenibacillus cymbidii]